VRRADQPKRRLPSRWRLVRSKSGGADSFEGLRVSLAVPRWPATRARIACARASSKIRSSRASSSAPATKSGSNHSPV
jgi:hypothetical protein